MPTLHIDEIPMEIKEYLTKIISISFPRQGYTSVVGLIKSEKGFFALKRTKGEQFCSMLRREVSILNCLTKKTKLSVPEVKIFLEENNDTVSWALIDFLEGDTLRMLC